MSKVLICCRCGEPINKDTSKPWRKHYCSKTCTHLEFECFCDVNRLTDNDGNVKSFTVSIQVKCKKCEKQFVFVGLPIGVLHDAPSMGVFGYEARLPIKPQLTSDKEGG